MAVLIDNCEIRFDKTEVENFQNKDRVSLKSGQFYSAEMLHYILENEELFQLLLQYFESDNIFLNIKVKQGRWFAQIDAPTLLKVLKSDSQFNKYETKINSLILKRNKSAFSRNRTEEIEIDGEIVCIRLKTFIQYLSDDEKYEELLNNDIIDDFDRDIFLYYFKTYFKEHAIFKKYVFDKKFKERFKYVMDYQNFDFEYINTLNSPNPDFIKDVHINPKLMKRLNQYIDPNYNDLEKIIYYYIMLAKTLSYDPEFYAEGQKGLIAEKHEDINFIKTITPENNECVCYEFDSIMDKLLLENNIKFEIVKRNKAEYGKSHSYTIARCGKFLIKIDSVPSVFTSDMLYSKIGLKVPGLECYNENDKTYEEFEVIKNNIFKNLNNKLLGDEEYAIRENLFELKKGDKTFKKFLKMTEILNLKNNLSLMEQFGLAQYLYFHLFTTDEIDTKVHMVMAKDNREDEKHYSYPIIFFVINKDNVNDIDENAYIVYDKSRTLKLVELDKIKEMFDSKKWEYLTYSNRRSKKDNYHIIPGLETKEREPGF